VPHVLGRLTDRATGVWRSARGAVRRRPLAAAVSVLIVLAVLVGGGIYGYGLYQWHAARRALDQDHPGEARERLQTCLWLWPKSVRVHLLAARAAWLATDLDAADLHLNRCLELNHGASEAIQLEFLLMRADAGDVDQVAPPLLDLVENQHHLESAFIMETLARAYMHNLQYSRASACLTRWIEEDPTAARAYHYRGWVQERVGEMDPAMQDYQRALELLPDLAAVRLRVAEILLEMTRPAEALVHLEHLRRQFPESPEIMARLGHCLLLQSKNDEARRLLEAAIQQLPDDSPLLHNLARLELQDNHPEQAEKWLRHALEVDGSDVEALYTLVSTLQLEHRQDEARAVREEHDRKSAVLQRVNLLLKNEARAPSEDAAIEAELGSLLMDLGRQRQALYWLLDQALRHDPRQPVALKAMMEYYEKKGEKDNAAAYRRQLLAVTAKKRPGS
jgi:Tfp pilus assembly protein PilF